MELAALASAAMPGLTIVGVASLGEKSRDFDSALITDDEGNTWRVRSPRDAHAGFKLETELEVLSGFTPAIRAKLPFRVPSVAGAIQLGDLRTFVYHQITGAELSLEEIIELPATATEDIGRIIAAIHQLPRSVVEIADLPQYSAEQYRTRLLKELDQAALTGKIPKILLRRWENAFEENSMWQFEPQVVHGEFHEEHLLFDRARAVGVTGWTDLQLGDPAQDFSWLASIEDPTFGERIIDSYYKHLEASWDQRDLDLMRRASLTAEFALAQYLMQGLNKDDSDVVAEAVSMLQELAEDVELTGGQDVGASKSPQTVAGAPEPETNEARITEPAPSPNPTRDKITTISEQRDVSAENAEAESPLIVDDEYHPVFFKITRDTYSLKPASAVTKESEATDSDLGEPTAPMSIVELENNAQAGESDVSKSRNFSTGSSVARTTQNQRNS